MRADNARKLLVRGFEAAVEAAQPGRAVVKYLPPRPAARLGLEPQAMLDNNNAYAFFKDLGDLVKTEPTSTNVNDIRIAFRCRTARG